MKDGKFDPQIFINNVELYLSALLFIVLTVLLFGLIAAFFIVAFVPAISLLLLGRV